MTAPVFPFDIDPTEAIFPYNAIELIVERFVIEGATSVLKRRLYNTDPTYSIGVAATLWRPDAQSYEMGVPERGNSATLDEYQIFVQSFVKDANEQRGILYHSALAELVRSILEDDAPLRASLLGLEASYLNTTKRLKKFYVFQTRFIAGDIDGSHLYFSTSELRLQTEKVSSF